MSGTQKGAQGRDIKEKRGKSGEAETDRTPGPKMAYMIQRRGRSKNVLFGG